EHERAAAAPAVAALAVAVAAAAAEEGDADGRGGGQAEEATPGGGHRARIRVDVVHGTTSGSWSGGRIQSAGARVRGSAARSTSGSIHRWAGRPLKESQASTRTSTSWPRSRSTAAIAWAAWRIRSGSPFMTPIWAGV